MSCVVEKISVKEKKKMEGTSIVSTLGSSFETVSADMMSAISTVLPIALGVAGAILVITLGWKLFKRLAK